MSVVPSAALLHIQPQIVLLGQCQCQTCYRCCADGSVQVPGLTLRQAALHPCNTDQEASRRYKLPPPGPSTSCLIGPFRYKLSLFSAPQSLSSGMLWVNTHFAAPGFSNLTGDDVDHTAHSVQPYKLDMGPRMISIRSIAETGGMKLLRRCTKTVGRDITITF